MRRARLLALALAVCATAAAGLLAGLAYGAGGSAADDQYPTTTAMPTQGQGPLTPPGAQASAPTGAHVAGQGATLPFTGLSLLKVVLVGAALLVLGILLHRGRLPRRGP